MSLHLRTLELLGKRLSQGWSLRQISLLGGDAAKYEWLKKLNDGSMKNPSVNRVEALYAHLKALKKPSK